MKLRDHIEKLYAFSVIARHGSLTRASKELALSQTALSHTLRVLEDVLEVTLLTRRKEGVSLTEAGRRLYEYSKRLALDIDTLEISIKSPSRNPSGKLRVGSHEAFTIHLWPDFLYSFSRKFPDIHVSLISGRTDQLVRGLLNQDFHLIVTVEPQAQKRLKTAVLYSNWLRFYAAPIDFDHRYQPLKKKKLSMEEAKQIPILTDTHAHLEQDLSLPRFLIRNGFHDEFFFEINSFEGAIRLAAKGLGLALLPERIAREAVKAGLLRDVQIADLPDNFGQYKTCVSYLLEMDTDPLVSRMVSELRSAPMFG